MKWIDIDDECFWNGTQDAEDVEWCNNTYSEVFDWFLNKGISISIHRTNENEDIWFPSINDNSFIVHVDASWHECADAAFEKALEILNNNSSNA